MSSLQSTLDEIHEKFESSVSDEIVETMHRATKALVQSDLPLGAVREGDTAPDFTLNDSSGRAVSSGTLLESGPLVISFFRGFW